MIEGFVGVRYLLDTKRSYALRFFFVLGLNLLFHGLGVTIFLQGIDPTLGLTGMALLIIGVVMTYVCGLAMLLSVYTVISVVGVTVGVVALTTVLSVMSGFIEDSQQKLIGANAHIVIKKTPSGDIQNWEPLFDDLSATPGVTGVSPFIEDEVIVTSPTGLTGVMLEGISVQTIGNVSDLPKYIIKNEGSLDNLTHPEKIKDNRPKFSLWTEPTTEGSSQPAEEEEEDLIDPEPILPGVLLGKNLAEEQLHVVVGDKIQILTPWGELGPTGPVPKSRSFRVAGIFYSGMYELDARNVYVSLEDAQNFLSFGDAITGFEAKVYRAERAVSIAEDINTRLQKFSQGPYEALPWQELNKSLFGAFMLEKKALFVALAITVLVASFFIVSSLLMVVVQKGKEIAILKSMGATGQMIMRIFLAAGAFIGLTGTVFGSLGGYALCLLIQWRGIPVPESMFNTTHLPVVIAPFDFVWVGIAAFLVSLLATLYPSMLASRLPPLEGLQM